MFGVQVGLRSGPWSQCEALVVGACRRPGTFGPVLQDLEIAARTPTLDVLGALESCGGGLSSAEASRRLDTYGPNALQSHGARAWTVLVRQLRNPLLILLLGRRRSPA